MIARDRRAAAGYTLIEIMISFVILVVLMLVITSAFLPLERATSRSNVDLDLDRTSRRVLAEIRRELRQSGKGGAVEKLTVPADGATITTAAPPTAAGAVDLLVYSMRTGPDPTTDWRGPITIRAVPDGTFANVPANSVNRYRLERVEGPQTVVIAKNVSRVTTQRPAGGKTVIITLELSRPDPHRVDAATVPNPITQTHTDQIQFLNQ